MKIRIISSREEINSIRPNEKAIHLAFRASNVDFLNLLQKVPRLQMVQVPPSYIKTMSKAIEVFLDMQGVKLLKEMCGVTERTLTSTSPFQMKHWKPLNP